MDIDRSEQGSFVWVEITRSTNLVLKLDLGGTGSAGKDEDVKESGELPTKTLKRVKFGLEPSSLGWLIFAQFVNSSETSSLLDGISSRSEISSACGDSR